MKRFSKRVRCTNCGKTHYATPSEPGRQYSSCPRCGQEVLFQRDRAPVTMRLGKVAANQQP